MGRALEQHSGDVLRIGPLESTALTVGKVLHKCVHYLTGANYLYTHTHTVAKQLGKIVEKRLRHESFDVIFAPAGSGIIAYLQTSAPIVYLSDTTIRRMFDYNSEFSGLSPRQVRTADDIEQAAISKATHLIYPSSWAAESAIADYNASKKNVSIVPFGANLDTAPPRAQVLRRSSTGSCKLLFVGVNWWQKGGDIAFETLLELEARGIQAELTIVGCTPPGTVNHSRVRTFPFLNKNNECERAQLNDLYREADFFILPTRSECFSIALCEANAFGIPILSTQTGGLGDLVKQGVNGYLFPLEARGRTYAAKIEELHANPELYHSIRVSSRQQFEERLNWDAWGKRVSEILWSVVSTNSREHSETYA